MKIFCNIREQYIGFRELESFNKVATSNWSKTGEFFPMYDLDTMEIFECAFNAQTGEIVAYATISIEQFRKRLEESAQELLKERVQRAIDEASKDVASIHSTIAYVEKMKLF